MDRYFTGSAKIGQAARAEDRASRLSIKELAGRYDFDPNTVSKWSKRAFIHDHAASDPLITASGCGLIISD